MEDKYNMKKDEYYYALNNEQIELIKEEYNKNQTATEIQF
mgnify:CR=1 FL=1